MKKDNHHYALILAGGVGTRFWPASRQQMPKQFLDILGTGKSLLQATYERCAKVVPQKNIFILTNKRYRRDILDQLPELQTDRIIAEPSQNNTAPAISLATLKLDKLDSDAVCFIAPSDHVIQDDAAFLKAAKKALLFAGRNDALLTLGIKPTRAATGYGYIEVNTADRVAEDVYKVKRFKEKPDRQTAEKYLSAGNYLWNSGIFVWSVASALSALRRHAAGVVGPLAAIYGQLNKPTEMEFLEVNYPQTTNISIDYAIMERAKNVYTIPAEIGWSDLGTWESLYALKGGSNVINADYHLTENVNGCLIRVPKEKLVVIKGLKDYIVVDEEDSLLIYPREDEQEIREVRKRVKEKYGDTFL